MENLVPKSGNNAGPLVHDTKVDLFDNLEEVLMHGFFKRDEYLVRTKDYIKMRIDLGFGVFKNDPPIIAL